MSFRVDANDGTARVGYVVVGGETISVYQSGGVAPASVCGRTSQVRDAIVSATGRECSAVSEFDLLDVVALELKNQGITTLDAGDFTGLRNLTELQLSGNSLGTVPETAFRDLVNLKELDLRNTDLTIVPAAIRGLGSLQRVNLSANRISHVRTESFRGLSELRWLWLHDNRMTTLPDGAFSDLRNLNYLHLDANQITGVRKGMWQGLESLFRLALSSNPLGELREDAFASLPRLFQLLLRETQLEAVLPETFAGFPYLGWLDLSDNRIDDLSGVVFPGDSIGSLRLANNQLSEIPAGMFSGFTSAICTRREMDLNLDGNPGAPFPLTLEARSRGL